MHQQGLTRRQARNAARDINSAKPVDNLFFTIGDNRRPVTLGGDGRPEVGAPMDAPPDFSEADSDTPAPQRILA